MNYFEQLFEVQQELLRCVRLSEDEAVDTETGEIIDVDALEQLEMDFKQKVYGIGKWIKNKQVQAEALKKEKMRIAKLQQAAERDEEYLTRLLDKLLDGNKFDDPSMPLVKVTYRKSTQLVVDDMDALPEEYKKYKDPEPDKMAIKKALKDGQWVAGVHEETVNNISVK